MLTRIKRVTPERVTITSADEHVEVTVERAEAAFPDGPLTRREAHEALAKVGGQTTEFLACVESDLHATGAA